MAPGSSIGLRILGVRVVDEITLFVLLGYLIGFSLARSVAVVVPTVGAPALLLFRP